MFTGKPTGKRPLENLCRSWENNIKMHIKEIGVSTMNQFDSAQDRDNWSALVSTALNLLIS